VVARCARPWSLQESSRGVKRPGRAADTLAVRRGFAVGALIAAVVLVAAIVLLTMGGSSKQAPSAPAAPAQTGNGTLRGRDFETSITSGWRITTQQLRPGEVRYVITSTATSLDRAGVPPAGSVGITITDVPTSAFAKGASSAPHALTVLQASARTPRGAKGVARVAPPRKSMMGGAQAAEEVFTYSYKGFKNVQVDVVAQHARRSVLIELDAEPGLSKPSQRALELLASGWRWR
jgi:hypothetical protein